MAITQAQLNDLYKLAAGMFDASPGLTYVDAWARALDAGMTITQIYDALVTSPEFESVDPAFNRAATNDQFANAYIDQLLGSTVSSANRTIALNFVLAQVNSGVSRAEAIKNAIEALDAIPGTDPNFRAAAQRFDNRVEGARAFTEIVNATTTDLNVLRNSIADVTEDPATVRRFPIELDPPAFSLTTNPDNIVGTNSVMRFSALSMPRRPPTPHSPLRTW